MYSQEGNRPTSGPIDLTSPQSPHSLDGNGADDWLFPAFGGQTGEVRNWYLNNATDVIFGGLNSVQGAGDHNSNPVVFDLQLHAVVPEPGSALLACVTALALGLRRRRPNPLV